MKKLILLIAFLPLFKPVFSQTVVVTDDASYTTGNASSVLDVKSVLKGFLAPRMTQAQRTAISSPADGLLVYQTDGVKGFYYYNGTTTAWTVFSSGTAWGLSGNSGTSSSTNFLGTTDNVSFKVRTNNAQRLLVDSLGNVAIGSSPTFTSGQLEKFLVDAGSSTTPNTSFNVISGKGYIDNYLQLNIQNRAATASASSDVVASNDASTESVNYIDMGINSSGNTSTGVLGGANTAYLYGTGNDFAIGNGTASKNLLFFTGGTGSNERMRIDGNGNVGIGTTTPAQKLDVNGSINAGSSLFVDAAQANTGGSLSPGLIFGPSGSGEGIASKRTSGTNQYSINFYTSSANRMSVTSGGNVGIGTTTPAAKLDVAGTYKLGTAGTVLTSMIKTNFTISDATSFSYAAPLQETVTVTGVALNANLILNPRTALPAGVVIAYSYVSAANTIVISFITSSGGSSLGTVVFDLTVIQ